MFKKLVVFYSLIKAFNCAASLPNLGLQYELTQTLDALNNATQATEYGRNVLMEDNFIFISAKQTVIDNMEWAGKVYIFYKMSNSSNYTLKQEIMQNRSPIKGWEFGRQIAYENNILAISESKYIHIYNYNITSGLFEKKQEIYQASVSSIGWDMKMKGNYLYASANSETINSQSNFGSVYIYKYSNNTWIEFQKISPNETQTDLYFGENIAVSGNYLAVTALLESTASIPRVYIYKRNLMNSTYMQIQIINGSNTTVLGTPSNRFGFSIDMNDMYIAIGETRYDITSGNTNDNEGVVHIFKKSMNSDMFIDHQTFKEHITYGTGAYYYGWCIRVYSNYILIGTPWDNYGAVYIYQLNTTSTMYEWYGYIKNVQSEVMYKFGYSVDMDNNMILVGAGDQNGNSKIIRAYLYKTYTLSPTTSPTIKPTISTTTTTVAASNITTTKAVTSNVTTTKSSSNATVQNNNSTKPNKSVSKSIMTVIATVIIAKLIL